MGKDGIGKFCDASYKGLEDMLFIAVVLVTSLFYRESINLIGLPDYLIDVAGPYMSAAWLPAIAFILIGIQAPQAFAARAAAPNWKMR